MKAPVDDPSLRKDTRTSDDDLAAAIARRTSADPTDSCWHGAEESFLELYDRYAKRVLAYLCRHGLSTDADDVGQEVWKRVWDKLPARKSQQEFRAWLFSVAHHCLVDHWRAMKLRKSTPLDESGSNVMYWHEDDPSQMIEDRERQAALESCLQQLEKEQKELVTLRWRGGTYNEICSEFGMDKNRAYKLYHDASQRLARCMRDKVV